MSYYKKVKKKKYTQDESLTIRSVTYIKKTNRVNFDCTPALNVLRPQNKVCGAQHEFYANSCFRGSVWSVEAQDLRLNPAFITNVICTLCSFCESGRLQRLRF